MPEKFKPKQQHNLIYMIGAKLCELFPEKITGWSLSSDDFAEGNITSHYIDIKSGRKLHIVWRKMPDINEILIIEKFVSRLGRR